LRKNFFVYILICLLVGSCSIPTGVFEKNISLPGHEWQSSFRPEISFRIKDTTSLYNIFFVIRHSDAYDFNNIWIRATVDQPGETGPRSQQYDLSLGNNEKGWIGAAMDDIYEARILIQPQTKFRKTGDYHFTLEQIMREDPLRHVLDVGIRIEKMIASGQ
jgi:gliding motility-associated lipoprotein GldH